MDVVSNKYVAVYESDSNNKIVSFKLIVLTALDIKAYTSIPVSTNSTVGPGSASGTSRLTANIQNYYNHFMMQVSSSQIATPTVGDYITTNGLGTIVSYNWGDDIAGVFA